MDAHTGIHSPDREKSVEAVARFVAWVHALERGDRPKASAERSELSRLGILVEVAGTTRSVMQEVDRG